MSVKKTCSSDETTTRLGDNPNDWTQRRNDAPKRHNCAIRSVTNAQKK